MSVEEQVKVVESFVSGIVDRIGLDGEVGIRTDDDGIHVEVTGSDLGLLIGPHGSTIDALQELARTVVQRRGDEQPTRVLLDVGGFRAKRATALESFVQKIAVEVIDTTTPQALEPMSAPDRKIVHDTVNSIAGAATSSEGTEPRRYVVIRPDNGDSPESDAGTDSAEI